MKGYRVYCVGEGSVDLVDALTELGYVPAQPAADTAALQARVAELEAANADTSHTLRLALTQLDWARWTRDEYANKLDKHRAELRELRTELDAARTSVQQIDAANQRDELRDRAHAAEGMIGALGRDLEAAHVQIAELTAERDDLAAKWAAVPWAEFEALMCGPNCPLNAYVRNWYNANSPYRQAQK